MKKVLILVLVVVVVVAGVVFVPELAHTCMDCGGFFVGTWYEPNVVADLFTDGDYILCKDCAETSHAAAILLGKSVG